LFQRLGEPFQGILARFPPRDVAQIDRQPVVAGKDRHIDPAIERWRHRLDGGDPLLLRGPDMRLVDLTAGGLREFLPVHLAEQIAAGATP